MKHLSKIKREACAIIKPIALFFCFVDELDGHSRLYRILYLLLLLPLLLWSLSIDQSGFQLDGCAAGWVVDTVRWSSWWLPWANKLPQQINRLSEIS